MSDWEVVENISTPQSEWEVVDTNTPNQSSEQESWYSKIPRNLLAGLASLGHRTMNAPHDVASTLETRLQEFGNAMPQLTFPGSDKLNQPQEITHPLSQYIPYQEEKDFPQMLGQKGKGTLMDKILQKSVEYAPEIAGLGYGAAKASPYLFKSIAAKPYKTAIKELEDLGITKINPPKELINDAKDYFKSTKANRQLIKDAESGDIKAIFKLQSDLGKKSAGYARNPFSFAERDFGKEGFKIKADILDAKQQELKKMGLDEIADLFEKGRSQYKGYQAFKPYKYGALGLAATQTPIPSYLVKLMMHHQ